MPGIRVNIDWLAQYSTDLRAVGDEIGATDFDAEKLSSKAFGEVGRTAGADESYGKVAALLRDRTRHVAEILVAAGEELHTIVDFHTQGEDDSARELARNQEG